MKIDSSKIKENAAYKADRNAYVEKFCSNEASKKRFFLRKFSSSGGVLLELKNLAYNQNEYYFTIIVNNESGLDYDIRDFEFHRIVKNKSKVTNLQRERIIPFHIQNQPDRVEGGTQRTITYVFNKFSIGTHKSVEIELREKNGERNIILTLDEETINHPNGK